MAKNEKAQKLWWNLYLENQRRIELTKQELAQNAKCRALEKEYQEALDNPENWK